MQFAGAINYIFKSANYIKICAILIICAVFVITSPVMCGYTLRIIRSIRDGNDQLPDLVLSDDFAVLYMDGLRLMVQMLLLFLPMILGLIIVIPCMASGKEGAMAIGVIIGLLLLLASLIIATCFGVAITCLTAEDDGWLVVTQFSRIMQIAGMDKGLYIAAIFYPVFWNLVFGFLGFIPIVGNLIAIPLTTITTAYFCGMYMRKISDNPNTGKIGADLSSDYVHSSGDNSDY